jgi:hypothetical protein
MSEHRTVSFGALGRRARRSSLGVKLGALGAAITAAVLAVAFWALSLEIRTTTRQLVTSQLARDQQSAQQLQAREASELLFAASLITQTPTFQYDLSIYRAEKNATGRARVDLVNTVEDELRNRPAQRSGRPACSSPTTPVECSPRPRATGQSSRGARACGRSRRCNARSIQQRVPTPATSLCFGPTPAISRSPSTRSFKPATRSAPWCLADVIDSTFLVATRAESDPEVVVTTGNRVAAASDRGLATPLVAAQLQAHVRDPQAASVRIGNEDFVVAPLSLGETQDHEAVHLWMLQPLTRRVAAVTGPLRRLFCSTGRWRFSSPRSDRLLSREPCWAHSRNSYATCVQARRPKKRQGRFDADREALEVRTLNDSFNQLMDSLSGKRRELEQRTAELAAANIVLTDEISERTRVERALRESEAQLRQSQKLEAIGTLAGGIAHDFNNLITVISGYTQLALMRAEKDSRAADDLQQVVEASDRAANLTHQLLAFSRKQVLQPTGSRSRRGRQRNRADAATHHRRAYRAADRFADAARPRPGRSRPTRASASQPRRSTRATP